MGSEGVFLTLGAGAGLGRFCRGGVGVGVGVLFYVFLVGGYGKDGEEGQGDEIGMVGDGDGDRDGEISNANMAKDWVFLKVGFIRLLLPFYLVGEQKFG